MYCYQCGAQLQQKPKFCPVCGTILDTYQQPASQQPAPPAYPSQPSSGNPNLPTPSSGIPNSGYRIPHPPPSPPQTAKKRNVWLWLTLGVVAAAVVIVTIVLLVILPGGSKGNIGDGDDVEISARASETPALSPTPAPIESPISTPSIEPTDPMEDTWAVYWYICGSDLETYGGFASNDIEEMLRIKLPENVTVVIETGGAQEWQRDDITADSICRFIYDSNGFRLIEKTRRANMGKSNTLTEFLQFCNDNYPADKRAVVFWNHGGGSVAGLMFDELYGFDSLTLAEMREAFEAVSPPSVQEPPYEFIGFDACLMATIDMVGVLNGYAGWMVASQEVEPVIGWDYKGMFQALAYDSAINGYQLGEAICDSYYNSCVKNDMDSNATLSVIDMSHANRLLEAYYDLGAESLVYACDNISFFGEFGRAARSAINYGGNNIWNGYANMVDLGDLVLYSYNLLPESGQALLDALDACVVYKKNGSYRDRASGLSCYYNYNGDYDDLMGFVELNRDTPFRWFYEYKLTGELSSEGVQFVQTMMEHYSGPLDVTERSIPTPPNLNNYPVSSENGYAIIDLGSDTARQLTDVFCNLAYYDMDNDLIIILGRTDDMNADWENGVFSDNFSGYWGSIGGCLVFMELTDVTDDYKLYTVPILLNGDEYSLSVSYTIAAGKYEILDAWRGIDNNGMADKDLRQLQPGDVIEPLLSFLFDMDDPDEDLTIMSVDSLTVTEDTSFEEIFLGDGYYILIYEMVDILNNSYLSDAVTYQIENGEIYLLQL